MKQDAWTLFSETGGRKYLCSTEIARFLRAAEKADAQTKSFCFLLAFTGCRISEALAVTSAHLDTETGRVIFRTLKRRTLIFRAVPIPPKLMEALLRVGKDCSADNRLWTWCRQTAWRRVKEVMEAANIEGPQAMPKGLRHGFGCANAEYGVPMATTKSWLGHASLETTLIYQQAVGREEYAFAKRLWQRWHPGPT